MKLTVIGTGYGRLCRAFASRSLGNRVTCVDKDKDKIQLLRQGEVPIYEPGLKELIEKNTKEGRLFFSDSLHEPVQDAEIVIIAVGTPQADNGEADLRYIEEAAREIAAAMNGYKIIMTKSTVPIGTNERIRDIIAAQTPHPFDVVSVPEFLREGSAVRDTFHPDRVIIGADNQAAADRSPHSMNR